MKIISVLLVGALSSASANGIAADTAPVVAPSIDKVDCKMDSEKDNPDCKKIVPAPVPKTAPARAATPGHPARPGNLEVIDDALPPPNILNDKEAPPRDEVTVRKSGDDTITEYRIRGRLYKQKVQPASGVAYILIDEKGEGKFSRVDGPDIKLAVPMWVLWSW